MNIDTQDLSSYIPGYDDYVDDTKPVYSTKEYYDMKELLESEIEDKEEEIERQKEVINGMIENEEKYNLEIIKLKSIIKEVREYIIQYGNLYCLKHEQFKNYHQYKVILEILDKENK